jgi:type I restriction enzyme, S subunit
MMETTTTKKALARYSAYKDSGVDWLGEIPVGWEVVRLKFGLAIKNGADYKHVVSDQGYPVIGSGGVFAYASQYLYDGEVVMLGRKGTIDTPLYFYGKFWAVDTMYYSIARNGNSARFLYFAATTIPFKLYSTATAMPSMTKGDLDDHPIALPPLPEQRAIATFLDEKTSKIDQAIRQKEKLIVLLKERKQILIQQAVTKGLAPQAKMKDSGVDWIGEIPEGWGHPEKIKFISITKGRLGWQGLKANEYTDEGPYILSSAHFNNHKIAWDQCPHVSLERYKLDSNIQLRVGDLLLMKDGAKMGKLAFVDHLPGLACLNSHLLLFRPRLRNGGYCYIPKYMFYLFQTDLFQDYVQINGTGSTFSGISQESIGNYQVCLPCEKDQIAIIHHIETQSTKIDASIALQEKQIVKLKEYKATLIDSVVTGKVKTTEE